MGDWKDNSTERGPVVQTEPDAPNQHVEDTDTMATSKSTHPPAFQFYTADFLSSPKVIAMSMTERGIYITLLAVCWQDSGLPTDMAALARLVGMKTKQFERLWPHNLGRCFVERGGKFINLRLESERKKQREFRERQRTNAARGWDSRKDATAVPPQCQTDALSLSSSVSSKNTYTVGGPLHASHKTHAHCGRVCVPGDLHSQFVRSRHHDGADQELRDWYLAVEQEWTVGAKKHANTGGNDYRFWRARFDEKWPDESQAAKTPKAPTTPYANWRPRTGAQS